jgi:hypothetical protein
LHHTKLTTMVWKGNGSHKAKEWLSKAVGE